MSFTDTNRTVRRVPPAKPTEGVAEPKRFRWAGGKSQLSDAEIEAIAEIRARKRVA